MLFRGIDRTTWVFFAFVFGNLAGTLLFSIGLLVSRAVPTWAAAGIALWPVLHITGLVFFHNEVPQIVGAVLQAVGFSGCGLALLRRDISDSRGPTAHAPE